MLFRSCLFIDDGERFPRTRASSDYFNTQRSKRSREGRANERVIFNDEDLGKLGFDDRSLLRLVGLRGLFHPKFQKLRVGSMENPTSE